MAELIYKIAGKLEWQRAEEEGRYDGAAVDKADGFIHFSTATQVAETAAKHFSGRDDLLLIAVDADGVGDALKQEPSRGGDLFPHLYAPLDLAHVIWVKPLPLGGDGIHVFPTELS